MTLNQIYKKGKLILKEAGNQSPAFDCMCILNYCLKIDRHYLIMNGSEIVSKQDGSKFLNTVNKRANGIPLQYIIGKWEFMNLEFKVGEGVLIPREDTQTLVDECLNKILSKRNPRILDLCAGSGAVGISIATKRLDSRVTCVEYSDKALGFLIENIKSNEVKNVEWLKGNVFYDLPELEGKTFDAIVSNPPYIKTDDIKDLPIEVQNEPQMALDGGKDGLDFYRAITNKWLKHLNIGGSLSVEIGMGQESDVMEIFENAKLSDIKSLTDMNNIQRVISAIRQE